MEALICLLALQESGINLPPLSSLPAPSNASWWPWVGWGITALLGLISLTIQGLREFYFKKVDIQRETDAKKIALELEGLKLDFEQRKHYSDKLEQRGERLEAENLRKDEQLWKAMATINERDKTIREQHDTISELKNKVSKLEVEMTVLRGKMESIQTGQS